jgi:hypothetical protein
VLKTSKPAARRTQAVGISDKKPDAAIMNIPGRTGTGPFSQKRTVHWIKKAPGTSMTEQRYSVLGGTPGSRRGRLTVSNRLDLGIQKFSQGDGIWTVKTM